MLIFENLALGPVLISLLFQLGLSKALPLPGLELRPRAPQTHWDLLIIPQIHWDVTGGTICAWLWTAKQPSHSRDKHEDEPLKRFNYVKVISILKSYRISILKIDYQKKILVPSICVKIFVSHPPCFLVHFVFTGNIAQTMTPHMFWAEFFLKIRFSDHN